MENGSFGPPETAYDVYKETYYSEKFHFSCEGSAHRPLEFGEVCEIVCSTNNETNVVTSLIEQFCHQYEHGLVLGVSSGNKIFYEEWEDVPASVQNVSSRNRLKRVHIWDMKSFAATLHFLKSSVKERRVLLVIYSVTPLLLKISRNDDARLQGILNLLNEFAQDSLAVVAWVTTESFSVATNRERSHSAISGALKKITRRNSVIVK